MPKSMRVGLWLGIGCLALAVQGCWDDGQESLTLLGEGGCRSADGGYGDPQTVKVASAEECEALCFAGETACAGVEYNGNNGACEVHRERHISALRPMLRPRRERFPSAAMHQHHRRQFACG